MLPNGLRKQRMGREESFELPDPRYGMRDGRAQVRSV